ncbi:MAG: HlyD family efflux transporter periplasmic adaptor subunit [Oscillospiraceae bacterium]|nr:HlyD family efflux transporter periplasmic adaptor subunit [Oscillospiraceae bacterium]
MMDKTKKKQIKRIIALACVAVVVVLLAVMPLLAASDAEAEGPTASILSGNAAMGSISTAVKGGGTLAEEEAVEITVPSGVMLKEFLVKNGDTVAEGDALAAVDRVSVMDAITQVQETLEYLAEQLQDARDEEVSDTVTAQTGGRVKILYAEPGDSVQEVMLEHSALAVLSLDGLMAVKLDSGGDVATGDSVYVTFEDGTEVEGVVESALGGTVVVTVEDEGYEPGTTVYVSNEDRRLGSGTLYIYNEWRATAYSGTVSGVKVAEEATVSSGATLMTLTDTEFTAQFQTLSQQRREYEALMLELFRLYQTEEVLAPCGGVVSGVDEDSAFLLSDSGEGWFLSFLANAPNGDDEKTYSNYLAQVTLTGENGWELLVNPQSLEITDYKLLSEVEIETAFMTEAAVYAGTAPIYELVEGEWRQIEASEIAAGDILLFAGDETGSFVWVVRISGDAETEEPTEPTVPAEPEEPVTPTEPTTPTEPENTEGSTVPTMPSEGGVTVTPGQNGGYTGSFPGITGGDTAEEETFELYSLDGTTIMSVTAQDQMTVSITVDELDIGKLTEGMTAEVKLDALKNETFTATVTDVATSGSSKFTVELTLDRGERMLSGMNATVTIGLDTAASVLTVPVAALNENGGETFVYTSYDEKSGELGEPVVVETGISDGENVEILSGLQEGQTCYYAYYDTLELSTAVESGGSLFGR